MKNFDQKNKRDLSDLREINFHVGWSPAAEARSGGNRKPGGEVSHG